MNWHAVALKFSFLSIGEDYLELVKHAGFSSLPEDSDPAALQLAQEFAC